MQRSVSSQDIQRLERLKKRFINWRISRKSKAAIPPPLWNAAVKSAMRCGLSRTAKALHLNYYDLQKKIEVSSGIPEPTPEFIELSPATGSTHECLIECENKNGAKMRIHCKGANAPDLNAIAAAFWRSER